MSGKSSCRVGNRGSLHDLQHYCVYGLNPLRRTQPVETTAIIRPPRVAEMDGTVGEGAGLQGNPDGIGQVGAGFNHDGNVRCAGDVEAEAICSHTGALGEDVRKRG